MLFSARGGNGPNLSQAGAPDHTTRGLASGHAKGSKASDHAGGMKASDHTVGPKASGHAEGMRAISRRLSEATPPETTPKHHASQRDASMCRLRKWMRGLLPSLRDGAFLGRVPVVSLTLNHRLIAMMPPASRANNRRLVMPPRSLAHNRRLVMPPRSLAHNRRLVMPLASLAHNRRLVMPMASRVVAPFAITPISTVMLALDCRLAAPMVTALFARDQRPAAETFAVSHPSLLRVWRAREFRPQYFPPANLPQIDLS
jgi:hypothetical protein